VRILLAGLPLKLRARITGELAQAEVVAVSRAEDLLLSLRQQPPMALVLHESTSPTPLVDFLTEIRKSFAGLLIVILQNHPSGSELKIMVRSDQVNQLFQDPAPADEIIKTLALELGLSRRPLESPDTESMAEVWHESLPVVREWLERLEQVLNPKNQDYEEARRAAHYLAGNLGTFGFPKGTLLAREAEQLLQTACSTGKLQLQRLERVVDTLRSITLETRPPMRPNHKVIVIGDPGSFVDQLDMEARLLQWETEVCDDFADLPMKLAQPQARVVVVEVQSAACKRNPQALDELIHDPYPTVAIAATNSAAPPSTPHCRWLERSTSPYATMIAVLRTQLAPTLDNPPCILVVDDDRVSLSVIARALTQVDFHVEALHSPLEFWERLENSQPDLILLDVELPNMSGIELCRAVRLDDRFCSIPVVFLSSYADSRTVLKAFEAGADDYLYKPVVPDEVRTRVSNRLQRCQQRQTLVHRPQPGGRSYTSLDQLMLRSLREDVPLGLAVSRVSGPPSQRNLCIQRLRAHLRGEDVVKPLGEHELLVAMLTPDPRGLQRRLAGSLDSDSPVGLVWFPEEGRELDALLELARTRLPSPPQQTSEENSEKSA
jgi:DNA-binding response OmpR family regulator/HPt (histidine-containing phosphotransfer) domain-containing protein